jgi:hypothetical protein
MNKQEIEKAIENMEAHIKAYENNLRSISTVNSINKDWDGKSALGQPISIEDKRYIHTVENLQACKLAISALEKQTPKKVYHFLEDDTFETTCCGIDVTNEDYKYCPDCGCLLGEVEEVEVKE